MTGAASLQALDAYVEMTAASLPQAVLEGDSSVETKPYSFGVAVALRYAGRAMVD